MGYPVGEQLDLRSVTASAILKTFLGFERHRETNLKNSRRQSRRKEERWQKKSEPKLDL